MIVPMPRMQLLRVAVTEITLRNMVHRDYKGDCRDEQFHNGPVHHIFFASGIADAALQILDHPDTREKSIVIGIDRIDHIPLYKTKPNPRVPSGSISYYRSIDGGVSLGWNLRLMLSKAQFESLLKLFLLRSLSRISISVSFKGIHSRFQCPENAFVEADQSGDSDCIFIVPSADWPSRTEIDCGLARFVFDSNAMLLKTNE